MMCFKKNLLLPSRYGQKDSEMTFKVQTNMC